MKKIKRNIIRIFTALTLIFLILSSDFLPALSAVADDFSSSTASSTMAVEIEGNSSSTPENDQKIATTTTTPTTTPSIDYPDNPILMASGTSVTTASEPEKNINSTTTATATPIDIRPAAENGSNSNSNTSSSTATSTEPISTTTIKTGAINIANALSNLVNNNIIGNGLQYLVNIFKNLVQNVDLSGFNQNSSTTDSNLPVNTNIANNSTSTIDNKLVIKAETGDNIIASSSGPSVIETGDISIVNDIINMANINIVGKGWFFAVVNIFGELDGDIIMPAMTEAASTTVAEKPASTKTATSPAQEFLITNKNFNNLENNIKVDANTGNNVISSSTYDSIIKTGSVNADTNVFNLVNYNVYSNSWKFYRINIFGEWDGTVHGLPQGYNYFKDENGITIYKELSTNEMNSLYTKFIASNTNYASTTNDIDIDADTGNNSILRGDSGSIKTGNIDITNNILNFINSNFIGDNWQFSLINVFGNWKGNLSFGKPDLWITQSNKDSVILKRGEAATYTVLYGNKGDSTANDAKIKLRLEGNLSFADKNSSIELPLGPIPPNTQGSISYTVLGNDSMPYNSSEATANAAIESKEGDRNDGDNSLSNKISLDGGSPPGGAGSGSGVSGNFIVAPSAVANLSVIKFNDSNSALRPGETVNYTIKIKNTGNGKLEKLGVIDAITNISSNEELGRNLWDIGTMDGGEEIILTYALEIKNNTKTGTYLNQATVEGFDINRNKYITALASSKIRVENSNSSETKLSAVSIGRISKKISAKQGEELDQEIIIANNGNRKIEKISVSEKLPSDFLYQDKKSSKIWNIDDLAPGQIKSIKYKIKVNPKAAAKTHQFTTSIKADGYNMPTNIISKIKVNPPAKEAKKITSAKKVQTAKKNTIKKFAAKARTIKPKIKNPATVLKIKNVASDVKYLTNKLIKLTPLNKKTAANK